MSKNIYKTSSSSELSSFESSLLKKIDELNMPQRVKFVLKTSKAKKLRKYKRNNDRIS